LRWLIAAALLSFADAPPAQVCDCSTGPICHNLWSATAVFLATADRVTTVSPGAEDVHLAITEVLRGTVGKGITLHQTRIGVSCDYDFTRGAKYLVYATRLRSGTWKVESCGGTQRLADGLVDRDLQYIRRMLTSSAPGAVSGYVHRAQVRGDHTQVSGTRSGVLVTLRSSAGNLTTRSGAGGEFRFDGVAAGQYSVAIGSARTATIVPASPIFVGPEACLALHVVTDP
jgi:hypothetical protein